MIQIQWEFLTIQTNISKEGNNYLEEKNESYRRMRIIYNNMIGTFITNQCVDEDFLIKKAFENLYPLDGLKISFSSHQFNSDNLHRKHIDGPNDRLSVLSSTKEEIRYSLVTSSDGNIREKIINNWYEYDYLNPKVIAEELKLTVTACINSVANLPWLFTPYAASKLLHSLLLNIIIGNTNLDFSLGNLIIKDPGTYSNFDFEGTKVKAITFVENGKLITPAYDLFTAKKRKVEATGHGGLNGTSIQNLIVDSEELDMDRVLEDNNHVLLIYDVNLINNDLKTKYVILTFYGLGSYMYKIVDIEKLLNKGKWIGTISMGIKPFKIKWLLLTKPLFIFDYFQ
ncbi:hypothetical protein ETJ91_25325 [Bacillus albus]|uniref:metallopeptidase TldD-related protein n=2 Tax=Bacillus albus TaxID=2026189 RepID=UPI001009F5A0|nr:metallopeptidase TldD-related protein [Bacillus albus]RXJ13596.1 hypothetical protein ETJ91_25325 [Bacillus albus]RXJ23237.1 hypothetical protein ETJ90_25930 [Bacillus albus]RXJ26864.1 hypothetical protein ETJ76_21785 [Bacillus albus]RXJ36807.1 hypothetical protein ETJ89_23900 [Bacillus albus]RXJ54350.1 hypothetical protein ETJ66_21105 [Bacillus albus]